MSSNTLFGKVPEDWTISKIGDIAELRQGLQIASKKRLQSQELGSIPLLKITDLPRKVFSEYVKDIPENYIATKEDIIYTRTGQVGLVYTDVEGCVHNNCFKVILDYNKFDKKYMYYYLNSPQVREYANIIASGSVQKDLTHKAFKIVKVAYPSLKEQKAIADILSSLDDKIELNKQMNETLEEMAQALFKRWFVDFEFPNEEGQPYKSSGGEMVESELGMIPKGWEVAQITEFGEVITGKTPSTKVKENYGDKYPFITIPDMHNNVFILNTERYLSQIGNNTQPKKLIPKNSLVVSCIATVGLVSINSEDSHTNQQINSLILDDERNLYYLYFVLRSQSEYLNLLGSSGTTTKNVNKSVFEKVKIINPEKQSGSEYFVICKPIFKQIFENMKQNNYLKMLRDTLLPKLMSGEIRVNDLKS